MIHLNTIVSDTTAYLQFGFNCNIFICYIATEKTNQNKKKKKMNTKLIMMKKRNLVIIISVFLIIIIIITRIYKKEMQNKARAPIYFR